MSVAALLASCGAALSLWLGSSRHAGSAVRGYRWLSATALFWVAGLIVQLVLSGPISSSAVPLSLADVAPLLALAPAVVGIMVLAAGTWEAFQERSDGSTTSSLLPRL